MTSRAILNGWPLASGQRSGGTPTPTPTPTILRAMGQNSYTTIGGFGGMATGRISRRTRSFIKPPVRSNAFSIVYALFSQHGANNAFPAQPLQDRLFGNAMDFAAGIELNPVQSFTGLSPRLPVTFGGQARKSYDPATWDPNVWFIESDIFDPGRYIEAGEVFAIHTGLTMTGASPSGDLMPYQRPLTNYLPRYTAVDTSATDVIASALLTATTCTDVGSSRTGNATGFFPAFLRWRVPKTQVSVLAIGDSITQDQKVGYGNTNIYDVQGDADGNRSWIEIGAARLGVPLANISRGSDGEKNIGDATIWPGRIALMLAANPTCIDLVNGANDLTTANPGGIGGNTAYALYQVGRNGASAYICTQAGTTASGGGPTGTDKTVEYTTGTAKWRYLGPYTAGAAGQYQMFGFCVRTVAAIRTAFAAAGKPIPMIRKMLPLPKGGTSTDNFTTIGGQTPSAPFVQVRQDLSALYNDMLLRDILRIDSTYTVADAIETSPGNGIYKVNGTASYVIDSTDVTHPVDEGQRAMGALWPAPPAVTAAQSA